jgi:hypothetical protein
MLNLTPLLLCDGDCADAMRFYHDCFGGELRLVKVSEMPYADRLPPERRTRVAYAGCSGRPRDGNLKRCGGALFGDLERFARPGGQGEAGRTLIGRSRRSACAFGTCPAPASGHAGEPGTVRRLGSTGLINPTTFPAGSSTMAYRAPQKASQGSCWPRYPAEVRST